MEIMKNSPIVVLDEHPDWLDPLYTAFDERGIKYEKIDISTFSYDPQLKDCLPFYVNRLSPSALNRGHESAFAFTLDYITHLESLGARVVNGSHTVLIETSKAKQASLMSTLNISQPKTVVLNSISQIEKYMDEFNFPVLIKPNCGGSGVGIQKFGTVEKLRTAIDTEQISLPTNQLFILQEFIQPRDGHIVRMETINGKLVYAMKVFTNGSFNLCPSDGCDIDRSPSPPLKEDLGHCPSNTDSGVRFELYENPPKDVVNAVERIVAFAGMECGGIEYTVGQDGQWYIYDINPLSILRASFKADYGVDGWGMLADYFIQEYHKVVECSLSA
jgi:biotin carboxylase